MNPFQPLADIAASQLGTQEDSKHTNAGAAIAKYQHDTNLGGQGWPWCAAFVDWCVHQFLLVPANAAICDVPLGNRPRTAAAFGLRTWGLENNCRVFHPNNKDSHGLTPLPGDLIVYTFSHCGIVSRAIDAHHFEVRRRQLERLTAAATVTPSSAKSAISPASSASSAYPSAPPKREET
jgi:hypothetical protein